MHTYLKYMYQGLALNITPFVYSGYSEAVCFQTVAHSTITSPHHTTDEGLRIKSHCSNIKFSRNYYCVSIKPNLHVHVHVQYTVYDKIVCYQDILFPFDIVQDKCSTM